MNKKKTKEPIARKRRGPAKPSLDRGAWGFGLDFAVMRKSGKTIPVKENVDFSAVHQKLGEVKGVCVAVSGIVFKRNMNFRAGDSLICRQEMPLGLANLYKGMQYNDYKEEKERK